MPRKNKSSQRRIEANQLNTQRPTTHGLATPITQGHFLHSEDERQFQTLLGEYLQTYQPQRRDEYDLLKEAVYAKWRQERFWLAETAHLEMAMARNERTLQKELPRADAAAHLANAVAESADLLKLYMRYGQQLHRQYLRCLKELRDLQSSRPPANPDREAGDPNLKAGAPNEATKPPAPPTSPEPNQPTSKPRTQVSGQPPSAHQSVGSEPQNETRGDSTEFDTFRHS